MDGVPYMTQPPVQPGEGFDYRFTLPNTGTFFFHPHCNTVEQVGRGLAGVLIVYGDAPVPYAADVLCLLKDWRIEEPTGAFLYFQTEAVAAKSGPFGSLRTPGFGSAPTVPVPASRDFRARLVHLQFPRV